MKFIRLAFLALILCVSASLRFNAQVRPVNDYGALGLGHLLNRLQTTASVMMVGAHPDDEDSALLAYLARGENARTAYLSLTRGDGGQNIIGPELGEALGIIRTEELLQARRLDGAEQYFARAYDYGFSKTLAEAKSKWPEDVIKCDVVRAIRLFRPMVVISRFTGTPADGHGHHQYAGYITPIAVKAAADPKQCTDAGEPWQVLKFYVEQSFRDTSEPTLKINTGQYDPLLGRTYYEIAMEGRSMHRSQGEGRLELHGDQFSGLNLIDSQFPNVTNERSVFHGIDTSIGGMTKTFQRTGGAADPSTPRLLATAQAEAEAARKDYDLNKPTNAVPHLLNGWTALQELYSFQAFSGPPDREEAAAKRLAKDKGIRSAVVFQLPLFTDAIRSAIGLKIDALAESETVVPDDTITAGVNVFFPPNQNIRIGKINLFGPRDWRIVETEAPVAGSGRVREAPNATGQFSIRLPANAYPTEPYWLINSRLGDVFQSGAPDRFVPAGMPFEATPLWASVDVAVDGRSLAFYEPVRLRTADPARGEIRREVNVVPALSVSLDRDLVIAPETNRPQTRRLVVTVTNNTSREQSGHISLNVGATPDLKVTAPNGENFTLKTRGAKASIPVDITVPANPAKLDIPIRASAEVGQERYALTMNTVAYPHIQTHRYYTPADATLKIFDLKPAPVKVAYIMGSGDGGPEAIGQMGMDVTILEEKDLASGDLSKFNTIVVGIRASETRPDLVANNARLLDYVRNGGTVVMQYQRFNWTGLAPFPVDTQDKQGTAAGSINRVVDENAPMKILEPQHPVFNFPNKITDADFNGWVQERNAYNLVTFDPQYTPLLESHDAGEQENKGGLVVAKVGKGNWVYCSYSFFRQLPAGVPGAYRLFANLLSLPKAQQ